MKRSDWTFVKNITPPLVLDYARLMHRYVQFMERKSIIRSNLRWRDAYSGQSVYVVGNGPSLLDFDLTELKRLPLIVMNNFHRASWCSEVCPVAHCIGEPPNSPAWTEPSSIINGTQSLSYWFHCDVSKVLSRSDYAGKSLHFVLDGYEPRIWGERRVELHRVSLGYQTTAIMAIEVALYMGFKDIRLVGFDHDWLSNPNYSSHFYSLQPDPEDKLGTLSYLQILRFVTRMWEGYYALREAARSHDATIINYTTGSYLDVFDRHSDK